MSSIKIKGLEESQQATITDSSEISSMDDQETIMVEFSEGEKTIELEQVVHTTTFSLPLVEQQVRLDFTKTTPRISNNLKKRIEWAKAHPGEIYPGDR